MTKQKIEIFETHEGQAQTEVRFEHETIWLSQSQMAELFDKDSDTIGLHLKNIFKSEELDDKPTTEDFSVIRTEGSNKSSVTHSINTPRVVLVPRHGDPVCGAYKSEAFQTIIRLIMNMLAKKDKQP